MLNLRHGVSFARKSRPLGFSHYYYRRLRLALLHYLQTPCTADFTFYLFFTSSCCFLRYAKDVHFKVRLDWFSMNRNIIGVLISRSVLFDQRGGREYSRSGGFSQYVLGLREVSYETHINSFTYDCKRNSGGEEPLRSMQGLACSNLWEFEKFAATRWVGEVTFVTQHPCVHGSI